MSAGEVKDFCKDQVTYVQYLSVLAGKLIERLFTRKMDSQLQE